MERKSPPADYHKGQDNTDRLGNDCCNGYPSHIHLKKPGQQEIPRDIYQAGNCHKEQRQFCIADSPEYSADNIIRNNENRTAAAD